MAVVAHFGTFDVENYGDLLFPAILERRLGDLGHGFVHVSPHGGPPVWGDCVTTVAAEAMNDGLPDLAGVVVGGGHLIHASPTSLEPYDQGGLSAILAYPSLWLGAAYLAAQHNAPYCWNAPGVPQDFSPTAARLAEWVGSITDYLAVRDETSRARLLAARVSRPVHVVPDTAVEVARLWSSEQLEAAFADVFVGRGREVPDRIVAIHLNRRYAEDDLGTLAARLDRIARRLSATPILIAMGPCHGDDQLQRDVGALMTSEPLVIDRPQSLREITACIARAEVYLGSSLHGMVTACSFGTRGMAVIPRSAGTLGKFVGFLEPFQLTRWLAETWEETEQRLDELTAAPRDPWDHVLDAATPLLDEHWNRLRAILGLSSHTQRRASKLSIFGRSSKTQPHASALVDKQGALDRLATLSGSAILGASPYAPIVVEQAILASQHLQTANEERRQKEQAVAEQDRLRSEADALQAAANQARLVLEERACAEAERLRAMVAAERRDKERALDEQERLLREAERLRATVEAALLREEAHAETLREVGRRLAQVDTQLVRLVGRLTTKTGERLLESAQRDLFQVRQELGRRHPGRSQPEGRRREGPHDETNRVLPDRPTNGLSQPIARDHLDRHRTGESIPDVDHATLENGTVVATGVEKEWRVDVVICVHNALDHVKRCLASVVRNTAAQHRVIVVDDGSDPECAAYLEDFVHAHAQSTLLRNDEPSGYTKAANRGLRQTTADMVVMLNSDTVVPPHWLERLSGCARSDAKIGIVGPLSNAASYQSVPERLEPHGDWALNPLPPGWDIDQLASTVAKFSSCAFPRVPFVNGFCFAITRAVIDAIGYLDEEAFPEGYGEENDYCLRAADAGFELAIADHAYVFHAKSRSYSHEQRRELGRAGRNVLLRKHGIERVAAGEALLRDESTLAKMRLALTMALKATRLTPEVLSVLFLLPVSGGFGGAHSVVQETAGLRRLGVDAQVAVQAKHLSRYRELYPTIGAKQLFWGYRDLDELMAHAARFAVVVGTIHTSMSLVAAIVAKHPSIVPAYYVQDYEPFFYPEGSPIREEATRSYTLVPDTVLFAKTRWLCDTVRALHGVEVHQVSPSLDHDVYFPPPAKHRARVRVAAMIRPGSPRRAARRTMETLRRLAREVGQHIDVRTFGCTKAEMDAAQLPTDFPFKNHGVLRREQVGKLLRGADIFLDLSDYQAFGRTGLEAMACDCAVVVPALGGANEYAVHRENALVVDTSQQKACVEAARELIADPELRRRLRQAGVAKANEYSIECAARSELEVLARAWEARQVASNTVRLSGAGVA